MIRYCILLILSWMLSGCAGYTPQTLEISDQVQYESDVAFCQQAAANYHPQFNIGDVAYATAKGAASNATGAVAGGLAVPAIGAASGGTTAVINDLDVMGHAQANVYRHCLHDKTARDHSALLANPND